MKSVSGIICLVNNLEETISFYETLGFEFRKNTPGISATAYLNWFWIEFLLKGKVITPEFKHDIDVLPKGAGQYLHISVSDVDVFHEEIVKGGLSPSSQPMDFPWGHREFVLIDPDGYKLVFFSKI